MRLSYLRSCKLFCKGTQFSVVRRLHAAMTILALDWLFHWIAMVIIHPFLPWALARNLHLHSILLFIQAEAYCSDTDTGNDNFKARASSRDAISCLCWLWLMTMRLSHLHANVHVKSLISSQGCRHECQSKLSRSEATHMRGPAVSAMFISERLGSYLLPLHVCIKLRWSISLEMQPGQQ